jgi:RNA polymerase sigma-54 factor
MPLQKKHYEKLKKYNVSNEQLKSNSRNRKAQSKPGGAFTGNNKITENVVPDFAIRIVDGELELTLNGKMLAYMFLKIIKMMQTYKESTDKSGPQKTQFNLSNKNRFAKWFIDANQTTKDFLTMNAIMHYQEDFFDGDETKLKPMILKDIADLVGYLDNFTCT